MFQIYTITFNWSYLILCSKVVSAILWPFSTSCFKVTFQPCEYEMKMKKKMKDDDDDDDDEVEDEGIWIYHLVLFLFSFS